MKRVEIVNAEAVVLGEGEKLLLVLPGNSFPPPDDGYDYVVEFMEGLKNFFGDRVLVVFADDVQMSTVKE